jgi:membrane-associated phospholipid phosphatase
MTVSAASVAVGYWMPTDQLITNLRQDDIYHLTTQSLGVISFPSFHFVPLLLCTWAFWPMLYLRIASLTLTGLMIVATATVGCHYSIDILGGLAVGFGSLSFSKWLITHVNWESTHLKESPQTAYAEN